MTRKPALAPHFWVGDRIVWPPDRPARSTNPPARSCRPPAPSTPGGESVPGRSPACSHQPPGSIIYGGVFLLGYLVANILSAWEHQRFVESVLASNGFVAVFALASCDELDRVNGDWSRSARPLERCSSRERESRRTRSRTSHIDSRVRPRRVECNQGPVRQHVRARTTLLRRLLRDKLTGAAAGHLNPPEPARNETSAGPAPPDPAAVAAGRDDPTKAKVDAATDQSTTASHLS